MPRLCDAVPELTDDDHGNTRSGLTAEDAADAGIAIDKGR
jgi:hypothetical protein